MRRLPPLAAVRVFEAAARHENFTQAAQELGLTQAAVSYQIRILEERLGLSLFSRSKQRVTLTDSGRKLSLQVSSAFDSLDRAFESVVADDRGILSISCAISFGSSWLAHRLGSFQLHHPDLALRLTTENRLVDFARDDVDVAIRICRGPWPGLVQKFLFRSHVTPVCSAEFAARHALTDPAQLLSVPRISPDDDFWRFWFESHGIEIDREVGQRTVGFDNQLGEMRAVAVGHGVAMMTPLFWQPEFDSGRIVQPFAKLVLLSTSYWLVYPEHKRHQRKIRAFAEWMAAEVAESGANMPPEIFQPPEG